MSIFRICFALYFLKLPALIGGGGAYILIFMLGLISFEISCY